MNITTKYNIGQIVRTVKENKSYNFRVKRIGIEVEDRQPSNNYKVTTNIRYYQDIEVNSFSGYGEHQLVGSREELINLL